MEKVCMNAWELPKVLEEMLKEKYGDDWEKYVKAKAINEEELEEQVKDKAKEQQKTQREKTLSGFLKKVGLKKRDMLQSTMLFDGVKEADALFQAERKIGDWIFSSAVFFFALAFIEAIIIICLLPLKEKVPYLVQFSNNKENFALVQKADSTITANKALIRSLVGAYVLNRESITHIEQHEKMRQNTIKEQSSNEVWYEFEKLIAHYDSIYTNPLLTRKVKIANIYLDKDLAYIDIEVSLYHSGELESLKRYKVVMSFEFKKQEINFDSMSLNPTGFMVTGYDVTEIAILKDLDEKNKVKDDGVKSRIIHTEKKDPHMSQYKDVKEQ